MIYCLETLGLFHSVINSLVVQQPFHNLYHHTPMSFYSSFGNTRTWTSMNWRHILQPQENTSIGGKSKITSGKLGYHYGNMKNCAEDILLGDFESSIMNVPFSPRCSPKAWQEGTIVMIKKRINSNIIQSLWTIVLYKPILI